jgi:hypothetical protein
LGGLGYCGMGIGWSMTTSSTSVAELIVVGIEVENNVTVNLPVTIMVTPPDLRQRPGPSPPQTFSKNLGFGNTGVVHRRCGRRQDPKMT